MAAIAGARPQLPELVCLLILAVSCAYGRNTSHTPPAYGCDYAQDHGDCNGSHQTGADGEGSCSVVGSGEGKFLAGPAEWNYPWLYGDEARYMECLDEFQKFSDEWEGVQGWIEDHLAELVEVQGQAGRSYGEGVISAGQLGTSIPVRSQSSSGLYRGVYRMLGVGSGSGEVDVAILRVLLPRHPRVSAVVVEPDPSQIDLYRQLVEGSEFAGVTFTYHQQTSSEFIMDAIQINVTYDLIHMVHVLYHIEMAELVSTFSHYYNSLSPGGIMFITYESDKSSLARIRSALQPYKPGMPPYMSIADVEGALSKVVPAYQRRADVIRGSLDVTACLLQEGERSASGERLWDFITRVVNFRARAPEKVVRRAADMLRRYSWADGGERIVTNADTAVVIVRKQSDLPTMKRP